jgi:hypothetical protein
MHARRPLVQLSVHSDAIPKAKRKGTVVEIVLEEDITPRFRVRLSGAVAARLREGIPRASAAERSGPGIAYAGLVEVAGPMMGERVAESSFLVSIISMIVGEPRRYRFGPDEHKTLVQTFFREFSDRARLGMNGSCIHTHRATRDRARTTWRR